MFNAMRKLQMRTSQRGVTLMEVLISIAVVAIGLLGVVSLVPVGGQLAQEGSRNDRVANVGRRSLREFRVREMQSSGSWAFHSGNFQALFPTAADFDAMVDDPVTFYGGVSPIFWIDPLAYALSANAVNAETVQTIPFGSSLPGFTVPRYTLDSMLLGPNAAGPAAELAFVFQDDLQFEEPQGKIDPPTQIMAGGKRYANGRYSWFATLTPVVPVPPYTAPELMNLATVIVAERNRFEPEHVVVVNALSDTANPQMKCDINAYGQAYAQAEKHMRVGRWLMLSDGNYFIWYRITGRHQDRLNNNYQPGFSLAGPVWPGADPANVGDVRAIMPTNVVNVYQSTIRIRL